MSAPHATERDTSANGQAEQVADATAIHVDRYESAWIKISVLLLVVFITMIFVTSIAYGIQVPEAYQRFDPNLLATPGAPDAGPFADPGLRELAPGRYEVYMVARTWNFIPSSVQIPAGSTVTFYITSADVVHGFKLADSNLNVMVLPGQISKLTARFDTPGTYDFICHEYCGVGIQAVIGHHTMYGQLIVTAPAE